MSGTPTRPSTFMRNFVSEGICQVNAALNSVVAVNAQSPIPNQVSNVRDDKPLSKSPSADDKIETPLRQSSVTFYDNIGSVNDPPGVHIGPDEIMWSVVGAQFVTIAILTFLILMYYLISPYMSSIIWAVVCSIVFHDSQVGSKSTEVSRKIEALRAGKRWPFFSGGTLMVYHVAESLCLLFGFRAITLHFLGFLSLGMWVYKYLDILETVVFCWIIIAGLGTFGYVVVIVALFTFMIGFLFQHNTEKFVRRASHTFLILVIFLTALCLGWHTLLESRLGMASVRDKASTLNKVLQPHMTTIVPQIRDKWEETAKDYHLHRYGELLKNVFDSFGETNMTWAERITIARSTYQNVTDRFNMTEQMHVVLQHVQRYGGSILDVALRLCLVILQLIVDSLGLLYEIALFGLLFSFLRSLPRTLLYYTLLKIRTTLNQQTGGPDDEAKITKFEKNVRNRFWGLVTSLLHVAIYHFSLTYVAVWLLDFPYKLSSSIVAALIALFPYIPKYFVATAPALLWAYFTGDHFDFCRSFIFLVILSLVGDSFLINIPDMSNFVIVVSMVLGLTTFGLKGVIVGPVIAMGAQIFWETAGADEMRSKKDSEGADLTQSSSDRHAQNRKQGIKRESKKTQ